MLPSDDVPISVATSQAFSTSALSPTYMRSTTTRDNGSGDPLPPGKRRRTECLVFGEKENAFISSEAPAIDHDSWPSMSALVTEESQRGSIIVALEAVIMNQQWVYDSLRDDFNKLALELFAKTHDKNIRTEQKLDHMILKIKSMHTLDYKFAERFGEPVPVLTLNLADDFMMQYQSNHSDPGDLDHLEERTVPKRPQNTMSVSVVEQVGPMAGVDSARIESERQKEGCDCLAKSLALRTEIYDVQSKNQKLDAELKEANETIKAIMQINQGFRTAHKQVATANKNLEDYVLSLKDTIQKQEDTLKDLRIGFRVLDKAILASDPVIISPDQVEHTRELVSKIQLIKQQASRAAQFKRAYAAADKEREGLVEDIKKSHQQEEKIAEELVASFRKEKDGLKKRIWKAQKDYEALEEERRRVESELMKKEREAEEATEARVTSSQLLKEAKHKLNLEKERRKSAEQTLEALRKSVRGMTELLCLDNLLAPGLPRDRLRDRISVSDWLRLKEDLREILKCAGLPLPSRNNMYGLRGGELFCFWDSSTNETLLSSTLTFLCKEDTQIKMCTNSIQMLRVYKTPCEVNVTEAPFQSYIVRLGRNETFRFGCILMPDLTGALGKRPRSNSSASEDLDHLRKRATSEQSPMPMPVDQARLISSTNSVMDSEKGREERDWLAEDNGTFKREITVLKSENRRLNEEIGGVREAFKATTVELTAAAKKEWEDVVIALEDSIRDQHNMVERLQTDICKLGNAVFESDHHMPRDRCVEDIISRIRSMKHRLDDLEDRADLKRQVSQLQNAYAVAVKQRDCLEEQLMKSAQSEKNMLEKVDGTMKNFMSCQKEKTLLEKRIAQAEADCIASETTRGIIESALRETQRETEKAQATSSQLLKEVEHRLKCEKERREFVVKASVDLGSAATKWHERRKRLASLRVALWNGAREGPTKNKQNALPLHHRLTHPREHDTNEHREVTPTHALSIVIQWQQDTTSLEWDVLRDGLQKQLKNTGLTVNWKNSCTLQDGALFSFWEMPKKSFSHNIEAYLSKGASLHRLKEQNVISITLHYECLDQKVERGSSSTRRVPSSDASQLAEQISGWKSESTSGYSTSGYGNLGETLHELSSSENMTGVDAQSLHASPHPPDASRLTEKASVKMLTYPLPPLPLHPSLPSRPSIIRHVTSLASVKSLPLQLVSQPKSGSPTAAGTEQLQPLRISKSSFTPVKPLVPSSLPQKRFAITSDQVERRESAKRTRHEESNMDNNAELEPSGCGKLLHHLTSGYSEVAEAAFSKSRETVASQEAAEAALVRKRQVRLAEKDEMNKMYRTMTEECKQLSHVGKIAQRNERSLEDYVNVLRMELQEAHDTLQMVRQDCEKAQQREKEICAALEEVRNAEHRLVDDHERLVNAERSALEAKRISEDARRVAEERQKTAEEKQRAAEEALSSERCQRIAAEQTLLDITSVSSGVNVFSQQHVD
ncbi:hypothetical protein EW145_g90 [Phellinidium pouzarii]|uniref:Uncharacterized protein n=1 Tax=Phellinidium pouzarii TaxID=167371 RepID=A0A4S4LJY4_9AGAM|nr:hypothetical protein EW145_g90 [Phellinidium pouzarii]